MGGHGPTKGLQNIGSHIVNLIAAERYVGIVGIQCAGIQFSMRVGKHHFDSIKGLHGVISILGPQISISLPI